MEHGIELNRPDQTTVSILSPIISIWSTNFAHIFQISALGCPEQRAQSLDATRLQTGGTAHFLFSSHTEFSWFL